MGASRLMRQYELVEKVRSYNPHTDEDLLNKAYVYAMKAHGSQTRASGDPYFSHPLQVAAILTDLKLDDATIAAALLHDTIEDTDATHAEIEALFGKQIVSLVDGLTKIKKLDLVSKEAKQAENLRKLLLAITEDVRVLLVKLADRLHNMRTLHYMQQDKRARIAQETLDIYAPLAGRMGMQDMREELEDLSFREMQPDAYTAIVNRLRAYKERSGASIARIESELQKRLEERGLTAKIRGREKRPYSIYNKMEHKGVAFEQLSDIYGFRVLVETVEDCYRVLAAIHTAWPLVPGRFKDYISTPKQNDYQSIHTTVIGPSRQRVELQIRTSTMDRIAEFGIAAHALYKDRTQRDIESLQGESRAFAWLRSTIAMLSEGDSPEEFLEHTKLELFQDQVFCFTPKGKLITLPRGANAIDFAYAVHTDVGNSAVGAKVNGKPTPLVAALANGDEVEILRADIRTPPAAWETLVKTGRARASIRRATRIAIRQQYAGLGQRILERAFERAGKVFSTEALQLGLKRLARKSIDDVLAAVGRGELRSADVVRAVHPDFKGDQAAHAANGLDASWMDLGGSPNLRFRLPESEPNADSIPIRGLKGDLPVRFAPESGAVPGDRIVGILTPGEEITLYPIQSPRLADFENNPELWLDVRWDIDATRQERYPARIAIQSINEPGALAQIAQVVAETDGNIDNLTMRRRSSDMTDMVIDLEVYDLKHLHAIMDGLRMKKVVSDVQRLF